MISKIFAAVDEKLRSNLQFAGEPATSHSLGASELATMSSPPNIVWELMGGNVSASKQASADGRREVRQIAMRHERVLVHVWGGTIDKTEVLANHFVAAAREACTSGFAFRAIRTGWVGQNMKTAAGVAMLVEVEFDMPFTAEPLGVSKPPHNLTLNANVTHPA